MGFEEGQRTGTTLYRTLTHNLQKSDLRYAQVNNQMPE